MVKIAPHFGHLTFASLANSAHPDEKTTASITAITMPGHFPNSNFSFFRQRQWFAHSRANDSLWTSRSLGIPADRVQALLNGENGSALRTFNLCLFAYCSTPKRKDRQNRQCHEDAYPFPHYLSPPFVIRYNPHPSGLTRLSSYDIAETNNKNQFRCQEKNITDALCYNTFNIETEKFLPQITSFSLQAFWSFSWLYRISFRTPYPHHLPDVSLLIY